MILLVSILMFLWLLIYFWTSGNVRWRSRFTLFRSRLVVKVYGFGLVIGRF